MTKALVRILAITTLFILSSSLKGNGLKAQSVSPSSNSLSSTSTPQPDLGSGIVVSVNLSENVNTYLIQEDSTGNIYVYTNCKGDLLLSIGDNVCYTKEKTTKGNIIIRDIVRK